MSIIKYLPDEIKQKIMNYLFYSDNTYKNLRPCLYIIKNYPNIIYNNINNIILYNNFYNLLLRWLNLFHNEILYNSLENKVSIHYELIDKTKQQTQNKAILNHLNFFQLQNLYKFLCLH